MLHNGMLTMKLRIDDDSEFLDGFDDGIQMRGRNVPFRFFKMASLLYNKSWFQLIKIVCKLAEIRK